MTLATPQTLDAALKVLGSSEAALDDRAAAYAVLQQIRLRVDRALKDARDPIIEGMLADGITELGPLSVKFTAVDPSYPVNHRENWEDATVQDTLAELRSDPFLGQYVRSVPYHLEIDVERFAPDVHDKMPAALELWAEMNRRGWRKSKPSRKSLAVREAGR
jgi:hypothetical protein